LLRDQKSNPIEGYKTVVAEGNSSGMGLEGKGDCISYATTIEGNDILVLGTFIDEPDRNDKTDYTVMHSGDGGSQGDSGREVLDVDF
jgi:hypothetical protein